MCFDCGCELADDPMGKGHAGAEPNGKSITNKTFDAAARAEGISSDEAKTNTLKLLAKELGYELTKKN